MPEGAYHYWFFVGSSGDEVTMTLTPLADEDPGLYLYGPDGEDIDSVDDGFEGEEEILTATLEMNGLYAIGIEEFNSGTLQYNLELTIE